MLYFMHTLEQALQPFMIRSHSSTQILDFQSILLLTESSQYDDSFICLATPEAAVEILQTHTYGCLITAGSNSELTRLPCPDGMTLIVTELPLISLGNKINEMIFHTSQIEHKLSQTSPFQTRDLLKSARILSDSSFVILDSNAGFVYDSIRQEDSDFFTVLIKEHKIADLFYLISGTSKLPDHSMAAEVENRLIVLLPFQRNPNNYLLCTASLDNTKVCQTAVVLRMLCESLLSNRLKASPHKNMSFQLFFSRVMSENGDSDDSLMIMLHNLAEPPEKNMRLVLVRLETAPEGNTAISLDHLLAPLSTCFPDSNIAIMATEIVILLSSNTMYCPLPVEQSHFEQLLEKYQAIAMIGNPFTSIMSMRATCRQCQNIFPIAMAVKQDNETRCMHFSRYTHYSVIDFCARSISSILGGSDIVILTHPGVVNLTRYDRSHGTNLRDVMFYYLMNDRSITKTSTLMFMHRNTTIYKIKKIEELIGSSMDDPYLRHNLIFSCLLLRYRELYQKEGISFSNLDMVKHT